MKKCTKCEILKPILEFHKHRITKDGYSYWCKSCSRENNRRWAKTPQGIYRQISNNARILQHKPLLISKEDFTTWYNLQKKQCVYCDVSEKNLSKLDDKINNSKERLTVDCIINELGYKQGNMVLSCCRCNFVKSDFFSFDEMREIAQKYVKPRWIKQLNKG